MNKKRLVMAGLILLAFFLISNLAQAQEKFSGDSLLDNLARLKTYQRLRVSSYDRSGKTPTVFRSRQARR